MQSNDMDAVQTLEDLTWGLINVDAPSWFINPYFKVLLAERASYDSIAAAIPLTLAPRLYDALGSSEPPPVDFFRSLPQPEGKQWGIYALLLVKHGCPAKLYVGSGTQSDRGVVKRFQDYEQGNSLPRFVDQAFKQGYNISHLGLLCWSAFPPEGLFHRSRARFLAIEAAFTYIFHAAFEAITDSYFQHLLPWKRNTVSWAPLCSHSPLREGIRGDLDAILLLETIPTPTPTERSQHYRERARAADLDGYRANDRIMKNAWAAKNRDRVNKTHHKTIAKAKAELRFHCDICDLALQSSDALNNHLACQSHADRAAGIEKPEPHKYSANLKAQRTISKASKKHYCSVCEKSFPNDWSLSRHKTTPRHIKKENDLTLS